MPKIVTANDLRTGMVLFLGTADTWVDDVEAARVFADADAADTGLEIAQRDVARSLIVDPFVTDKAPDADGKFGMTLRDRIRAFGPTIAFLPADEKAA